jgi:hypothetical protein
VRPEENQQREAELADLDAEVEREQRQQDPVQNCP